MAKLHAGSGSGCCRDGLTASRCPGVVWSDGFTVRGGEREVCEGKDQDLEVVPVKASDSGLADRCTISAVRRLSADELAALPRRGRP
jgi:hypothetical protein